MAFSREEVERYSRQIVLDEIGYEGQLRLKKGKVLLIGVGGLGSPIALQLTSMGVGNLRIVDRDVVELSNLHRQPLYSTDDIGYPKVEVAAAKLKAKNPGVKIEALTVSVNQDSIKDLIKGVDVVVDGLDSIETRYVVNRACIEAGIPFVYGAAIETIGSATTVIPRETACIECFAPNLEDDQLPKCGTEGVHPSILSIIGSIEASEAVRILMGKKPNLAGRLAYFDVKDLTFDQIDIERQTTCPSCGDQPHQAPKPIHRRLVRELCGREQGKRALAITPRENLNLDIEDLTQRLKTRGFKIEVAAKMGVTFRYSPEVTVSILSSGVAVVVGAKEEIEALTIYSDVISEEMQVDLNRVDPSLPTLLAKPRKI
ncbi:MAG: HesA/MoeB/ThiF family protein [Thaumarchaeota archaeon]|nr:HesA/MoeB/ThiF family protein [Nitrososphaerota archaeon]MCL5316831.1 HesA/MoeB/ThiF family protein [Nitrososphaerota archaeon]